MKKFIFRFLRLLFGLFLYALGIVVTVRANVGYAPWDVFHAGISGITGISFGTSTIAAGLAVGTAAVLMGEKLGLGTLLNMVLIGWMIDFIMYTGIIPVAGGSSAVGIASGIAMLIMGMFIISFATYFYIKPGFGAGPRDSLMVAVTRKTGFPVGICRGAIETTVMLMGWLMGGMFGIGTLIYMLGIGFCIEITFRLLKFNPKTVEHQTLRQNLSELINVNKKDS